jgi:hypothetical protein
MTVAFKHGGAVFAEKIIKRRTHIVFISIKKPGGIRAYTSSILQIEY